MTPIHPYIEAHHEAVHLPRVDGRQEKIKDTWWNLMEAFHEYEPKANVMAAVALIGCGAIFGAAAMGIVIGLFFK